MSRNSGRRFQERRPLFLFVPVELYGGGNTTLLPHAIQLNGRKSRSSSMGKCRRFVVVMTDNGRRLNGAAEWAEWGTWSLKRGTHDA